MSKRVSDMVSGENGFGNIVYGAIGLVIFLILITSVVMPTVYGYNPSATLYTAGTGHDTCGTYSNETCTYPAVIGTMWGIIPIVVIASAILFVIGKR
jgi:hypothetical protein